MNRRTSSSLPLIIATCRHILDNGAFCKGATVTGEAYCRHHLALRERFERASRSHRRHGYLKLPAIVDLPSLELAQRRVQIAAETGQIDAATARVLFSAMRAMGANFRYLAKQEALNSQK